MKVDIGSISVTLDHPIKFWNLQIEDAKIREAGFFVKVFNYIASFFSFSQRDNLLRQFEDTISQLRPTDEDKRKLLEKVNKVKTGCQKAWFYCKEASKPYSMGINRSYHPKNQELMQPITENGRYVNHEGEDIWGQFFETLRLLFPGSFKKPTELASLEAMEYVNLKDIPSVKARESELAFYWTGHSTLLLQASGFNLLFDPAFGFVSPCFTRYIPSPIDFQDLPLIDILFVSHAHGDHCEEGVIQQLASYQPHVIAPKNFREFFTSKGFEEVHDLNWWERREFSRDGKKITFTSIPAKHGAQRDVSDMNKHLWHGVMLEVNDKKIYFAGDTAYDPRLIQDLKKTFGTIDLAFIPIAPEREEGVHLNCEQSLQFFEEIEAKKMFPIHFGVYRQSAETLEHPYLLFLKLLDEKYEHLKDQVILPIMGRKYTKEDLAFEEEDKRAVSL